MDRNSVIGFILIGIILIVFFKINQPSPEEIKKKRELDSIARVEDKKEETIENRRESRNIDTEENDSAALAKRAEELEQWGSLIMGEKEFYTIENDLLKLTVTNKGGRPYAVELKEYQTYDSLPLYLFNGDSTVFNIVFSTQNNKVIKTNELYFDLVSDQSNVYVKERENSLALRLDFGEERYMEYIYTLSPVNYMVDFQLIMNNMDDVIRRNENILDLKWEVFSPQQERGRDNENMYSTICYKEFEGDVDKLGERSKKEIQEEDVLTKLKWIAFKDQFFSSVLIADKSFNYADLKAIKLSDEDKYLKNFIAEIGIPYNGDESYDMKFYFGPNKFKILKGYKGLDLEDLLSLGMAIGRFINKYVIIAMFNFLERFISNYGLIILIMTFIIKLGLLPLTYKSFKSQAKMRVLKPQIDEINKKIPKEKAMDRQKATMDLYRKVGVNPMGGCLPMVLQMPILFAMFRFFPTSIELRQEAFLWAQDLSTYDAIVQWEQNIPIINYIFGNHISLFTLLMTASTLISMKMGGTGATDTSQMPGMKGMMYIMPLMFMVFLNKYSSGLTYYYFLANLITIGQNYLFKSFIDEDEILKKLHAKKAKPKKKSGFQARLEEMAKQRGYNTPKKR